MATADDYAAWIVKNADKKGTPEFETVAKAYQIAKSPTAPARDPAPSAFDSAMIQMGGGADRLAAGLRQMAPAPVRSAIDATGKFLGMGENPSIDPADQAANKALLEKASEAHPVASFLGQVPQMALGKTPLGMAAISGMEYGTPQERALSAGGAYLGGKGGELLGSAIGKALQPIKGRGAEAMQSIQDLLERNGITGTAGQISGSRPLQWIEQSLSQLPGGGSLRQAFGDQQQGLNKATMSAMGSAEDTVTPKTVEAAKRNVGKGFELPAETTVDLTGKAQADLAGVKAEYTKNLSPDQKTIVQSYLDDIASFGDSMPGDVYQKARSRLAARAASATDSEMKLALKGIGKALDDAFDRSAGPEAAATMAGIRQQYRVAKTVDKIATPEGNVSPARLSTKAKDLPNDLSMLGSVMRSLPSSGTAERAIYQGALTGGIGGLTGLATGDPTKAWEYAGSSVLAPFAASKALTSDIGKKYLTKGLLNVSPEVLAALQRIGAAPGAMFGQQHGGLLGPMLPQ